MLQQIVCNAGEDVTIDLAIVTCMWKAISNSSYIDFIKCDNHVQKW